MCEGMRVRGGVWFGKARVGLHVGREGLRGPIWVRAAASVSSCSERPQKRERCGPEQVQSVRSPGKAPVWSPGRSPLEQEQEQERALLPAGPSAQPSGAASVLGAPARSTLTADVPSLCWGTGPPLAPPCRDSGSRGLRVRHVAGLDAAGAAAFWGRSPTDHVA